MYFIIFEIYLDSDEMTKGLYFIIQPVFDHVVLYTKCSKMIVIVVGFDNLSVLTHTRKTIPTTKNVRMTGIREVRFINQTILTKSVCNALTNLRWVNPRYHLTFL
jgi:hypothetical protein